MTDQIAGSYTASVTRLKDLVSKLESAEVDVDELEAVVKESVQLVTTCRARLHATQTAVDTLLVGLQNDTRNAGQSSSGDRASATAESSASASSASAAAPALPMDDDDPFA